MKQEENTIEFEELYGEVKSLITANLDNLKGDL